MVWNGQEGSVWIGRGGDPSAVATLLRDASGGSEASELLILILNSLLCVLPCSLTLLIVSPFLCPFIRVLPCSLTNYKHLVDISFVMPVDPLLDPYQVSPYPGLSRECRFKGLSISLFSKFTHSLNHFSNLPLNRFWHVDVHSIVQRPKLHCIIKIWPNQCRV